MVRELMEARNGNRALRFRRHQLCQELQIVDELRFATMSNTETEMLFEFFSNPCEPASTLVTSDLLFAEWT